MPRNGWGFRTGNRYRYQAVVEDLFLNAQRPGRVGSRVKNPDPVPCLTYMEALCGELVLRVIS